MNLKERSANKMSQCKVITVENQKGGTGKSTTVLNLGVGLVRHGKKGMLIDADPQGSLSISLGIARPDDLDITLATIITRIQTNRINLSTFSIVKEFIKNIVFNT